MTDSDVNEQQFGESSIMDEVPELYDEGSIKMLDGLEAVRKRPGMYIGNTGTEGLHHLPSEIIDNAVDEALAGFCSNIHVEMRADGSVSVQDDGRGIPVGEHSSGRSALEVVMTVLHAGAKFENSAYKVSGGLHGVGAAVVNALSDSLEVTVAREGGLWRQSYQLGIPDGPVERIDTADWTGTKVVFKPSFERFTQNHFDISKIREHLELRSFLIPNTRFVLTAPGVYEEFYSTAGIRDLLVQMVPNRKIEPIDISTQKESAQIRVVLTFTDDTESDTIVSYANGIKTPEGGSHVSVFRNAFSRAVQSFAKDRQIESASDYLEEFRRGMTTIIDTRLAEPQFEGQTKGKLRNPEYQKFFTKDLTDLLKNALDLQAKPIEDLIRRSIMISTRRQKMKEELLSLRKSMKKQDMKLSSKLDDCTTRKFEDREIFIVEGDSAGGSLKKKRINETQAVLPLRGKTLNVERALEERIHRNESLLSIASALGLMLDEPDYSRLRYNRVIVMTDADADGNHIRCLLLNFFKTYFPELYTRGHVYVSEPPLYRAVIGSKSVYLANDSALDEFKRTTPRADKAIISRFKGLGEMNPEQLWDTCVNPETRVLLQIDASDTAEVNRISDITFGDDADLRKVFIRKHAAEVDDDFRMMI